jgi:hypothetical protein
MQATLERTIFSIDVLSLHVRVDRPSQQALRGLVRGRDYSARHEGRIVATVLQAEQALVRARFEHDVSLARYRQAARQLRLAARDGLMARESAEAAAARLSRLLAPLGERGLRDGDVLVYRLRPDSCACSCAPATAARSSITRSRTAARRGPCSRAISLRRRRFASSSSARCFGESNAAAAAVRLSTARASASISSGTASVACSMLAFRKTLARRVASTMRIESPSRTRAPWLSS